MSLRLPLYCSLLGISLVATALSMTSAMSRRQAPPDSGTRLQVAVPATRPSHTTFSLGYWNIASAKTGEATIAAPLKPFDIVGLSEVRGQDQLDRLAQLTSSGGLFAPTELQGFEPHFGNALLSKLPVTSWQQIPLKPGPRFSHFRNVLLTRIPLNPDTTLTLLVTHIDRTIDRQAQLHSVLELFESLSPPVVIVGDLNTTRSDARLSLTLSRPDVIDAQAGQTVTTWTKDCRIDWMLVRGLRVIDSALHDQHESDHPLIWATLTLP